MMFGEYLTERKVVPPSAISEALAAQQYAEVPVGRLLRDFGHLDQGTLDHELADFLGPQVETNLTFVQTQLADNLDHNIKDWAAAQNALVFRDTRGGFVLLSPHWNDRLLETFEHRWKNPAHLLTLETRAFESLRRITDGFAPTPASLTIEQPETDEERLAKPEPFTSLFRDLIHHAHTVKASDIHIEPSAEGLTLRVRLHGELVAPWKVLPIEHRDAFIRQVKKLSNLSISVSGRPQDSRMRLATKNLNLRVNLFPVLHGEKICLRLLDQNQTFSLEDMDFEPAALAVMKEALYHAHGVVLISGPTGSGKTTTLYSLLRFLDCRKMNIVTLEDPVEYELAGINQGQVTKAMTFAQGLRSILRQDPDVILVGEVRDSETADLCFKAASTGHLVLSTLHANTAIEVVSRLVGLGVERELIRSNLRLAIAQRLAQRLCPRCRIPFVPTGALVDQVPSTARVFTRGIAAKDCECMEGVVGRVPILDWMSGAVIHEVMNGSVVSSEGIERAYLRRALTGDIDIQGAAYAG